MSKFADDELYPQVVQLSKENDTLSITRIQRTFRIGYNRAAWLLEHAAEDGHVRWEPTGFKWVCTTPTVSVGDA